MKIATCAAIAALVLLVSHAPAEEGWVQLIGPDDTTSAWKQLDAKIITVGDVSLDPDNPRQLRTQPGEGVLVNPSGKADNLVSKESFGSFQLHAEFMIAKGSNSGVKLHGHYEIQILDTAGKKEVSGADSGGVYPLWHYVLGVFTHIDRGTAPLVNAARPAGEWQTLELTFRAPRFDESGEKTANARLVEAKLNDQLIHRDVELSRPTGYIHSGAKEAPAAPLLLQMDHGPVAFRNLKVRPLDAVE